MTEGTNVIGVFEGLRKQHGDLWEGLRLTCLGLSKVTELKEW